MLKAAKLAWLKFPPEAKPCLTRQVNFDSREFVKPCQGSEAPG